ncbi:MAG TPA: hypothetical protein EYP95_01595, partial [Nitrospinaceae bacterium]|nr:hypothetical protein [Nitrospinaceae bacterium]
HDLRKFLQCGILAYGFARVRCETCSENFLVAYSCKGRGICSFWNSKRMFETATYRVEHRFPQVPVRQWMMTLSKRLPLSVPDGVIVKAQGNLPIRSVRGELIFLTWSPKIFIEASAWRTYSIPAR